MNTMNDPDELLDLVDENDQVIGTVVREEIRQLDANGAKGLVRATDGFIMNTKRQIWVPRRTAAKKIAPKWFNLDPMI